MKGRELERVLRVADELAGLRSRLRRAEQLEQLVEQQSRIAQCAPQVARAAAGHRAEIELLQRSLEAQWVAQGPLVAMWQRATELAELAACAGADVAPYQADVEQARRRVEAARLETREDLGRLSGEREALVDVVLAAPFELPVAGPVRDDGRPEAGRRDALALVAYAVATEQAAREALVDARAQIARAGSELAELGDRASLTAEIDELVRQLPQRVELDDSAPPSVALRLGRAGIVVESRSTV